MNKLTAIRDRDGKTRLLGALPRVMSRCGDGFIPELTDDYLISESAWPKFSRIAGPIVRRFAVESPDIDQWQQGSCTYSALMHNVMQRRAAMGMDNVLLAQSTGYAFDGVTGSGELIPRRYDSGMALDVAIMIGRIVGGAPASVIDPFDWKRKNWPDNWRVVAYRNSIDKWRDCSRDMKYIVSTLCNGLPLLHGYAGHSRMLVEFDSDKNRFGYKGTYGSDWNEDGFGWLSWKQVDEGRRKYGTFCPITVRDPIGDGDVPVKEVT